MNEQEGTWSDAKVGECEADCWTFTSENDHPFEKIVIKRTKSLSSIDFDQPCHIKVVLAKGTGRIRFVNIYHARHFQRVVTEWTVVLRAILQQGSTAARMVHWYNICSLSGLVALFSF